MAKSVKPEPLTVLYEHSGFLPRRSKMIGNEDRRGEWDTAASPQRREREIRILRVEALFSPRAQMSGQFRVQRNVSVRRLRFGLAILAFCPAFGNPNPSLIPQQVRPAQRQDLRSTERGSGTGQD